MKPLLVALLPLLIMGLIACNAKSARDYNERIVAMENSLLPDIQKTEDQVSKFFIEQSYDSAVIASRRMEKIIEDKIEEIEKIEPPHVAGAGDFKKAYLKYFDYIKSIYTSYKHYAMQTNEEDRETERQKLLKVANEKEEAEEDLQRAQAKFAKANGLRVENK